MKSFFNVKSFKFSAVLCALAFAFVGIACGGDDNGGGDNGDNVSQAQMEQIQQSCENYTEACQDEQTQCEMSDSGGQSQGGSGCADELKAFYDCAAQACENGEQFQQVCSEESNQLNNCVS